MVALQTLRCPSCGAPAAPEATRCEYCRSRLATVSCPSCFGLLFEGAAFCQHCGAPRSRSERADGQRTRCPGCRGEMQWIRVGSTDLLECGGCDGTWVEAATFERLCADRESRAAVLHTSPPDGNTVAARTERVRYRRCPRCGKMMNRINFGRLSGTVVDVCRGHGTFLDRGELHRIVQFIQNGGLDRSREAQRQELVEQQRRLLDIERTHARLEPAPDPYGWNASRLEKFLATLLGRG